MARSRKPGRVKAKLLDWLGVPIGLTSGEFWQEWFAVTSKSGQNVTVDSALQLSTVWACVRLLSETISTLPLRLYQRMPDGSRQTAKDHPLYQLLCRQPNPEMTPQRFMLMVVASICLRGNAYVEKRMIGGRIISLVPLLPQHIRVERTETGQLKYTDLSSGTDRVIPTKNIMHIRGFGLDGISGLKPIGTGREIIGHAMSAEEAAAKFFAQGLQASGFLTVEGGAGQGAGTLTEAQRAKLRKSMEAFQGSRNAGKTMVLEAGLKYQGITIDPESAQMLETRSFAVEEMCRWFRVPPFMVGHMDKQSSWASSVEAQNLHFLTNSLRPLLVNIEQEISRCLIGIEDEDVFAEFAVEGLLRADSTGRSAYYNTALQNGWMSRNEVRRLENLPPIPGGDTYTVQSALVPLDQLGIAPQASAWSVIVKAAIEAGDLERLRMAVDQASQALEAGHAEGPAMAHTLMSLDRQQQAA